MIQVVAYLYHDAASAESAHSMLNSTMLVLAADRRPELRNETPLVTLAQAEAMVAAERERCAELCEFWDATHPKRLAVEIRRGGPSAPGPAL